MYSAMTIRLLIRIALLSSGLAVCFTNPLAAEASRPYHEEEREPRFFRLLRPKMDDPAAQLAYAHDLREDGRRRGAERQYRALVRYWPSSHEAAKAQYAYAQILEERGKLGRALDEYEYLMEHYTGQFPHEEVLARLYDMGQTVREERRGQFFFFPGFHAPERAIPYFEAVVANGPQWERAPEAQLKIAQIKEEIDHIEEAVFAYDRVETRYPGSPQAEEAGFGKGRTLYELSREAPNHLDGAETALHALAQFVRSYPDSEHIEEARTYMRTVYRRMARISYDKARYYDRIARRPLAAITTYERFLEEFPDTEWSDTARDRLQSLRAQQDEENES